MKQSRCMSMVESIANVVVGYGMAVTTQILIFPSFGLHTTLEQDLKMGAVFTLVSIARSFTLRRVFEARRLRTVKSGLPNGDDGTTFRASWSDRRRRSKRDSKSGTG